MNPASEKLGQNMKRIRTKKKMSQGDIACALEVDRGYIRLKGRYPLKISVFLKLIIRKNWYNKGDIKTILLSSSRDLIRRSKKLVGML